MVRNLVSWLLIAVCAVAFCGIIAGCGEEQAKKPAAETPIKQPVPVVEEKPVVKPAPPVVKEKPVVEAKSALPRVAIDTNKGRMVVELDIVNSPITVKNFLRYTKEGFYSGTVFHRVIPKFMIQGGGFNEDMFEKTTHIPIKNEAGNGLKNLRGTIAMARRPQPDSASSQFFINLQDNAFLNYGGASKPGYAVFGKVVEGMSVVDDIAKVPTTAKRSKRGMNLTDNPVDAVIINSVTVIK